MGYARFIVGNKSGAQLAELSPGIGPISWRLNKVGKVSFSLAITDSKTIRDNLRFGNRVLIEFDNGLPNWGGVLDPPRKWDGARIKCTAYSAAHLFKHRITGKNKLFSGSSVGAIFKALIEETNLIEDTGVEIGSIYGGGTGHSPDYHYKKLLDIFQKSLTERMSNSDYDFIPSLSSGRIIFTANFYDTKGSDKTNFALVQGRNITKMRLTEQGPILNYWDVAGEGVDWTDDRIDSNAQDSNSIKVYGLRQGGRVYVDVSIQATLDENAISLKNEFGNPFNIFELEVANKDPAQFGDYDLGDTITLLAPDYGFDGIDTTARILDRSFNPESGLCSLVVQEVL